MLENLILGGHTSYKLELKMSSGKKVGEIPSNFLDTK